MKQKIKLLGFALGGLEVLRGRMHFVREEMGRTASSKSLDYF